MPFEVFGWEYQMLVRRVVGGTDTSEQYAALNTWSDPPTPRKFFPSVAGLDEVQGHVIVPHTRGSRDLFPDQTIKGNRLAGGPLRIKFGREDLDYWLPLILGAEESTNVFKTADRVRWFHVLMYKGANFPVMEYRDCKIARATFSGSTGGPIDMDLDIVCRQQEEFATEDWELALTAATPFVPSLATRPLRFAEGFCSINAVEAKFEQFSLQINNNIGPAFFAGSDAFTAADEGRRITTLGLPVALTSTIDEYYKRGFEGLAGILRWTADNMETRVDLPQLFWDKRGVTMSGEGPTRLPLQMMAYRTEAGDAGADNAVKFTNDPTFV